MTFTTPLRYSITLILSAILFCANFTTVFAQGLYSYNSSGQKVYLDTIPNDFMVYFPNGIGNYTLPENFIHQNYSYYTTTDVSELQNYNLTYYTSRALTTNSGQTKFYESHEILLCFKNSTTENLRNALIAQHNLTFVKNEGFYERYRSINPLEVSADIYETGLVHFAHPNFMVQAVLNSNPPIIPNDPYFDKQYYLHNTGLTINQNETGIVDADMDVAEAWNISKGDSSVVVAVLDGGFSTLDSTHPDLPDNRILRIPNANIAAVVNKDTANFNTLFGAMHGTNSVGIIGAEHNNGIGISGIAPNSKVLPVNFGQGPAYFNINIYANAYFFAMNNGASIMSNSFSILNNTSQPPFAVVDSAINLSITNDVVICQASGNTRRNAPVTAALYGDTTVLYPSTIDNEAFICVGASDKRNRQAEYSPNSRHIDVVAPSSSSTNDNDPFYFSSGVLDVWTMGKNSEDGNSGSNAPLLPNFGPESTFFTGRYGGTSAATPMVAGVVALVRAANPCLNNLQVKKVLTQTADKIGTFNYNWSNEKPGHSKDVGYGKVNALKALQAAQQMNSASLDLMIKDVSNDFGHEPDTIAKHLYISEDIWVRNNPDGFTKQWHEPPQYAPNTPIYVYVRITNKSCIDAFSGDSLKLYWAKAATALSWPNHWNGSIISPALMGDTIGAKAIDTLIAGTEKIIAFSWQPPDPTNYVNINSEPWHFCLLARIISPIDTMTVHEDSLLWRNVRNNNNIAWKNVSIIKKMPANGNHNASHRPGAVVAVGNDSPNEKTITIKLIEDEQRNASSIFEAAEIRIVMDDDLFAIWQAGEEQLQDIEYEGERTFLIVGEAPEIQNLTFSENERATLHIGFNLLTEEAANDQVYYLYAEQYEAQNFIGGEQYLVDLGKRPAFYANAGIDETINSGETIQLQAYTIGEPATYNWYNLAGNLVYTGTDTSFIPQQNETYTLEVIANYDGYKDYDEKKVNIRQFYLNGIFPNPAENGVNLTVNYQANSAASAYINLVNVNTNVSNTYVLNLTNNSISIPLQNLAPGTYFIQLFCNGQQQDAQTLNIY